MEPRHDLRRNLYALWRDARVLVSQFRISLLAFATLTCVGTLLLRFFYIHPETGASITWSQALYATCMLVFTETILPFPSGPIWIQILFFAIPLLGLIIIAEGLVSFGVAIFNIRERKEAWQMAIASTYHDHVIVCGLGRVGYRVVTALLRLGEEVIGIEQNSAGPFLGHVRQMNVPVLLGDARQENVLHQAQIERAAAIVACTEDDLSNLAIALDARTLNPEIKIVMRMFDGDLAEKVRRGFGIHTAFSTSALAAPVFAAAATRAQIDHSFYVNDTLMNVARAVIQPGSALVGSGIAQVEKEFDISIILYQGLDTWDMHPDPDITLRPGDQLVVFASLEALTRLHQQSGQPCSAAPIRRERARRPWMERLWSWRKK
ncbi:MAG TPA: hypothetical protein ENN99_08985 [Chloroflexi bacterium]|nr:hypothetical protein [Chloroflexota bacterium]